MKILVAVPSNDVIETKFVQSLLALEKVGQTDVHIYAGSLVYVARNTLSDLAQVRGYDYVLWIDSDQTFPPDLLPRLYRHNKDFVTGVCYFRKPPYTPVIYETMECEDTEEGPKTKIQMYTDRPLQTDIFQVAGCGFGVCLTSVKMLTDVKSQFPEAPFTPIKNFGEDLSFCWKARQLGYEIWCDPTIDIGHIAHFEVNGKNYKNLQGDL